MFARTFVLGRSFIASCSTCTACQLESSLAHGNHVSKRYAGHSKWANIVHTKTENDAKRSMIVSKLSQKIRETVRASKDPNPDTNSILRNLIANAKKQNVPSKTIEEAIRAGLGNANLSSIFPFYYSAPSGISSIVEVNAENQSAAKAISQRVQSVLKKGGFKIVQYPEDLFKSLGIVIAKAVDNAEDAYGKAMEDAIASNFTEVNKLDDGTFEFQCSPDNLESCTKNLLDSGYDIEHSQVEYLFEKYVKLKNEDEILKSFKKLEDKLVAVDGFVRIVYNTQQQQ